MSKDFTLENFDDIDKINGKKLEDMDRNELIWAIKAIGRVLYKKENPAQ